MGVRRGDEAKESAKMQIIGAFGDNYLGIADKKIYVKVKDGEGGDWIEIAISMTCPKTSFSELNAAAGSTGAWTESSTELSEDDAKKVAELKKLLGVE